MNNFGIYGLRPGTVLKSKRDLHIGKDKQQYDTVLSRNLKEGTVITVLTVGDVISTLVGPKCFAWIYYEDKKWYTELYQNDFFDEWEKICD